MYAQVLLFNDKSSWHFQFVDTSMKLTGAASNLKTFKFILTCTYFKLFTAKIHLSVVCSCITAVLCSFKVFVNHKKDLESRC